MMLKICDVIFPILPHGHPPLRHFLTHWTWLRT
jgi:hypothetical protein